MNFIKRYGPNLAGRDFAVGDIHGHFSRLRAAQEAVNFDPARDRLFACGDLIDRGPECRAALAWLDLPWFHSVRGNHDDYVCRFDTCDSENWVYNGGAWFAGLAWDEQREFAAQFAELPLAIEVEVPDGLVGIVHADCPFDSWDRLRDELAAPVSRGRLRLVANACMWSRRRIEAGDASGVGQISAVICGHSPHRSPVVLGNVYHIDTGGWLADGSGHFTLLNLQTLEAFPPIRAPLGWEDA